MRGNLRATERLLHMAEQAQGTYSLGKKLLGSLMVVIGVLMVITSALAFASSLGGASVFSAWGSVLGLHLIQTQVAALSLSAAAGTGLTFWGSHTIAAGARQGLSQDLMETYNAALKGTSPSAPVADAPPTYCSSSMSH